MTNDRAMLAFIVFFAALCLLIGFKMSAKYPTTEGLTTLRPQMSYNALAGCYTVQGTARDIALTDSAMSVLHLPRCK